MSQFDIESEQDLAVGEFNIELLVDEAVNRFQIETEIEVTDDAKRALIEPALPHAESARAELDRGSITYDFLLNCVISILNLAAQTAAPEGIRTIDEQAVRLSMAKNCPYFGWC